MQKYYPKGYRKILTCQKQLEREQWTMKVEKNRELNETFSFINIWNEKIENIKEKERNEQEKKEDAELYNAQVTFIDQFERNIVELLDKGYTSEEILEKYSEFDLTTKTIM